MQFTVFWIIYRYWDQVHSKHENLCIMSLKSKQKQGREQMKFMTVEVFIYLFLFIFIFDYRARFVCVKDRTWLRIEKPVSCFNIWESLFGTLFFLFDRKLTLESKIIWQSMRKFPCTVWRVGTFPHMDKEETSFIFEN